MGCSLKQLVEKYGFNIRVQSLSPSILPFTIVGEDESGCFYWVYYKDGSCHKILKECESTNDYVLLADELRRRINEEEIVD